jgi:hypothetical protein
MSQSASQAKAFYQEVAQNKKLWTVKDTSGFPAPKNGEGKRVQPFWSSLSRVQRVITTVPAYSSFEPYAIDWDEFAFSWVTYLIENRLLVGINWSGRRAIGYDLEPAEVKEAVESYIRKL